jgi:hypothetical protein
MTNENESAPCSRNCSRILKQDDAAATTSRPRGKGADFFNAPLKAYL